MNRTEYDDIEQRLQTLARHTPSMPQEVELRLRERLAAAQSQRFTRGVRRPPPFSPGSGGMSIQLGLLIALLVMTGWLVKRNVVPYFTEPGASFSSVIGGSSASCESAPAVAAPTGIARASTSQSLASVQALAAARSATAARCPLHPGAAMHVPITIVRKASSLDMQKLQ